MKNLFKTTLFIALLAISVSCSDDNKDNPEIKDIDTTKKEFVANYVNIVKASYDDALTKAKELQSAINTFVENPTQEKFDAAKKAWLDSREPYGQTEAYRFYDGPIDGNDGEPEGYINAWPLDEGLIDYVADGTSQGNTKNLVNDLTFELTKENIKSLSGEGGEENVTIGYHAIEFLLWGQDLTAESEKKPGQRSYKDYLETDQATAKNGSRRKLYLKLAAQILVEDLQSVANQWIEGAEYRTQFLKLSSDDAIVKILTGMAKLSKGELAGERMFTAIENQSQEDEHSCFSDNTHRDIYLNAKSINNLINGSYTRIDGKVISGTSLLNVLALQKTEEATALKTQSDLVMSKVEDISNLKFFDYQIMSETIDNANNPIMSAVNALRKQGDELAQAGKTLTGKTIDPSV